MAAPTAGLHFTPELMNRLRGRGIQTAEVTLHVGAGTFKPVKSSLVGAHDMHTEFISVSRETIERLLHRTRLLITVGTTSARTVESLYYIGKKLHEEGEGGKFHFRWDSGSRMRESDPIPPNEALEAILHHLDRTGETSVTAVTQLMIAPGYPFHYPDGLITNFHQPRSTLLLLVAAFIGEGWRDVYQFALENDFRFELRGRLPIVEKPQITRFAKIKACSVAISAFF